MNSIPQYQLETKQIDRLAAQQYFYLVAARMQTIQIICSVPVVLIGSLIVVFFPNLNVYTAFWGLIVTFIDIIYLNHYQNLLKQQAAKVQELFDCHVLDLEWNNVKLGRRPEEETILDAATKFNIIKPNYSYLKDWYPPEVGNLPIYQARIICQRTNCWWDAKLRRYYANWLITLLFILALILLILGLISDFSLENFILSTLVPLMPAFVLGTRQYNEHIESANSWQRLKEYSEQLWEQAINGQKTPQELTQLSRCLQDEIYEHRYKSPLIFDWLYNRLRPAYCQQTDRAVKVMIEEALKSP
ncbi:MAG TPA: S-4TM family putative pore-forming effector [Nostocaceae cyanobacterium]|nr:S-4TM family putative pore-forming effector [Nostocaceae cyanobacterium]